MFEKTPLQEAIYKKDFTKAKELIEAGETFPETLQDYTLRSIFETLVKNKAFDVLDALVKNGTIPVDVYELEKLEYSIFEVLFKHLPADDESLQYLSRFIGNAENVNDEVNGQTLLGHALNIWAAPEIVQTLIDSGLNIDFLNNAEDSLVIQAVRINMIPQDRQLAYIRILLNAGVDINKTNIVKQTALHVAIERDKKHLLDILLESGTQPNDQDDKGNSAYYYALAHKMDGEIYGKLSAVSLPDFTLQNRNEETALSEYLRMMSGADRDVALLEQLVDDGADLDNVAPYYSRPKSGWDWIIEKPTTVMQRLLAKTGRDVNLQDDDGNTLLHKVCAIDVNYSHDAAREIYKKVKLLLELGADASITNSKDETAMMLASGDNLKAKTAELLLSAKNK
ncbi:MAG: ankyrin repeat domain-containing protein [Chitinophagaceae bacterium]|nr:ankyrin repeat domain-containing protein [Chitinophagaceae bacterium]MCW5927653.1 ankyrin repeat domain-containing protein [Chitinophagaceae bacterium]